MTKKISILGSTGSIGHSTIDLVLRHPDRFEVVGLACGNNIDVLKDQIHKLNPRIVSVASSKEIPALQKEFPKINFVSGQEGAVEVATYEGVDILISAIVGAAGLLPTLAALEKGIHVGLANKESMVIAGELMNRAAKNAGAIVLPVDSEHSALFQCLQGQDRASVSKLILTASGGPFLHKPLHEFKNITVKDALKHPNWSMGPKITIDSATMMNKGLEVMEARWLFDRDVDQIDICVHPQSIIHSMVEYKDGSVIAQMGVPDMRPPIAYALSYPERIETGVPRLNLNHLRELTFFQPDFEKSNSLKLCYEVARKKETYPAVLNAANEIAVDSFLKEKISFLDIITIVEEVLNCHRSSHLLSLSEVLESDQWARRKALELVEKKKAA